MSIFADSCYFTCHGYLLRRTFWYFVSAQLPCAFAGPAGWGDIVIAVVAPAIVGAMRMQFAKTLMLIWNTIGLIDIIFRCFQRAPVRLKRLAVDARFAGTAP
jgi:hypothetical protein